MVYPNLTFPASKNRPYFYANFVATVDGKVQVKSNRRSWWPIGSKTDYATLTYLRSHADALIQGKNTALEHRTLDSLGNPAFRSTRKSHGKDEALPYIIVGTNFDATTVPFLTGKANHKPIIATSQNARIAAEVIERSEVVRLGEKIVDISALADWLHTQSYNAVLVEGGPTLLSQFLAQGLIDEIFLTIAPKIFGNQPGQTLTMVEGHLFSADKIPRMDLISAQSVENEVYLRYKMLH